MSKTEILSRLRGLEPLSRQLEPPPEIWRQWLKQMQEFGADYIGGLPQEPTSRPDITSASEAHRFAQNPQSFSEVFVAATESLLSRGLNTASPGYMAYIPGGGVPTAAIGDFMAAITNRFSGLFMACPGATEMENDVIQWFTKLFGYPSESWGTLLSGGSMANLVAVLAARETRGYENWPRSVVYLTEQRHYAVTRALRVAGLGHVHQRFVPVDERFKMKTSVLRERIQTDLSMGLMPWMVLAAAGTTNTGAIDELDEISQIAERYKLWFHVDAAYGGFFVLTEKGKSQFKGIEKADSIALDPHKGLFMPYGTGAVVVRQGALLKKAFAENASYLAEVSDPLARSPADYSPELTRHFRGLRVWLSLKVFGTTAFAAALEEKLLLADWAFEELQALKELEVLGPPQLSLVPFRVKTNATDIDEATKRLLHFINSSGKVHLSTTQLDGKLHIRIAILSFRTHLEQVKTCVELIKDFIHSEK